MSLGALGVITQVRLRVLPAYRLHERQWECPFEMCMADLDALVAGHRHCEFFWWPQTDLCEMKSLDATPAAPDPLPDRSAALRPLYPEWEAFQRVRRGLDSKGRFMNAYLETLLDGI